VVAEWVGSVRPTWVGKVCLVTRTVDVASMRAVLAIEVVDRTVVKALHCVGSVQQRLDIAAVAHTEALDGGGPHSAAAANVRVRRAKRRASRGRNVCVRAGRSLNRLAEGRELTLEKRLGMLSRVLRALWLQNVENRTLTLERRAKLLVLARVLPLERSRRPPGSILWHTAGDRRG
jgi:hypothetical protein